MSAVQSAKLSWFAAGDEIFRDCLRASRSGKLTALWINRFGHNTGWSFKWLRVLVARQCNRALHEVGPERRGRLAAGQAQVSVVVKPDPDDAEKVRGEPCKPSIAGGSRLPCRGRRKTQ